MPLEAKLFMFVPSDYDEKKAFEAAKRQENEEFGDGNYQIISNLKVEDNDEVPLYKAYPINFSWRSAGY